jgi:hypothetical protein
MVPSSKIAKLFAKIDQRGKNECHIWQGTLNYAGYGRFSYRHEGKFYTKRAHRMVMELHIGRDLLSEELVCHKCDNPACCNVNHLFIGTTQDNVKDRVKKKRSAINKTNVGTYKLFKNGTEITVVNLKQWCREKEYNYQNFKRNVIYKGKSYEGWTYAENVS